MRSIIAIVLISVLGLAATACGDDDDDGGGYACFGDNGVSNHCWESPSDSNEQSCIDQGRTFASGSCPDNGYTVDCGDYFVPPGGQCV